jgi:hypothetical protein
MVFFASGSVTVPDTKAILAATRRRRQPPAVTQENSMADNEAEASQTPVDVPLTDQAVNTRVNWDDSRMATTFANVVNVLVTREELTLLFGMNQTWNAQQTRELTVQLSDRIVLTPYAAKRLLTLLTARMRDYEERIGPLTL